MGRTPCCSKVGMHRGPWTPREDTLLTKYIQTHGEGHWRSLPKKAGLLRCGKSCRLRWMNYLRPDIKRGNITADEDDLIIRMHSLLGNRWSLIAGRLPGRTDNEIKNYWNTHLSKRLRMQGTDPITHKQLPKTEPNSSSKKPLNRAASKRQRKGEMEEAERPKVHLPKPVRFTSIQPKFHSSEGEFKGDGFSGEMPWLDVNNDMSFLVGADDPIVSVSDIFDSHQQVPTDTNLEKLYEEYWQLLKPDEDDGLSLDSFAESLLL